MEKKTKAQIEIENISLRDEIKRLKEKLEENEKFDLRRISERLDEIETDLQEAKDTADDCASRLDGASIDI